MLVVGFVAPGLKRLRRGTFLNCSGMIVLKQIILILVIAAAVWQYLDKGLPGPDLPAGRSRFKKRLLRPLSQGLLLLLSSAMAASTAPK